MSVLLSTAYFPPVEYFAVMADEFTLSADRVNPSIVYLEAAENYQKQSYRNRCVIYSASGPESLTFPVIHRNGTHKIPVSEIQVDYSRGWVVQHERAIASAYGTSAFYEYYKDELFSILESEPELLFDLNMSIMKFFIEKTGISVDLRLAESYELPSPSKEECCANSRYGKDYRELIHPKRENTILEDLGLEKPYFQVFSQKYGFIPNLSIMDLLFNEGPDSILYLKRPESLRSGILK